MRRICPQYPKAAKPFAANPELRKLLVEVRRSQEQTIDEVSAYQVIEAGFSQDQAGPLVQSFKVFIEENRDEITALRALYQRPYRQRLGYAEVKSLADALRLPPRSWTTDQLWEAYRQLDRDRVRGSGQRVLADVVSLVRFAIGDAADLAPFANTVEERFTGWLAMQETAGRAFNEEQLRWLEAIKGHISGSVSIEMGDCQYAPFSQQGGLAQVYSVFGEQLVMILDELNTELVA